MEGREECGLYFESLNNTILIVFHSIFTVMLTVLWYWHTQEQ